MPANYPTKYTANRLNVTTNTVRNWSEQYADYLSASARPGQQSERRFTERDLTVFEYIKQLRSEGLKEDEIKQRLSETSFADTEVLSSSENALQEAASAALAQTSPDVTTATPALIVALDDLERRFEALERSVGKSQQNQRDYVQGVAVGALGMGVLVMILIGLAVLYGGFR